MKPENLKSIVQMRDLRRNIMQTQLSLTLRRLFNFAYVLFSNPQTVRLAIVIIVVCLALVAIGVPALSAMASGLPTGGQGSATPAP
jgi:hypothetical protein